MVSSLPMKNRTEKKALVAVIMGSESDWPVMKGASDALKKFGIPFVKKVRSVHRTPVETLDFAKRARKTGLRVIIAGAGGAAHLPGMVAAVTDLPVIGVPVPHGSLAGQDALYSIVQMPKGVPVATVAIGGAWNAGLLAARILAASGLPIAKKLERKLATYHKAMARRSLGSKL